MWCDSGRPPLAVRGGKCESSTAVPAFFESHAPGAWLLVPPVAARALLGGSSALGRYFLPSVARVCDARCWHALWRTPALPNLLYLREQFRWSVPNSNSNAARRGPNTRASQLTWLGPLLVSGIHDGTWGL